MLWLKNIDFSNAWESQKFYPISDIFSSLFWMIQDKFQIGNFEEPKLLINWNSFHFQILVSVLLDFSHKIAVPVPVPVEFSIWIPVEFSIPVNRYKLICKYSSGSKQLSLILKMWDRVDMSSIKLVTEIMLCLLD